MSHTLQTMFLILVFAGIMFMQFNLDSDRTANRQIKNALELAVHDAALALDESHLISGQIVFDQGRAMDNFKTSLETSLRVEASGEGFIYSPLEESRYQNEMYIEHIEFFDDSNSLFPFSYNNPDYNIIETLQGPGVVAVLTTVSPRYFRGNGMIIRKTVVYEYQ
ncbi:peptidase M23 [Bacillus alkalicellulosilyticus]|uniref:peptidase M23 n=1 Tax=Alkalihalobacterium alkalicellulosilyticum TaxID=1912214 RepID=UPI0009980A12|nr:peptidase M23 [Bacillus alkalicellulosilyticus]